METSDQYGRWRCIVCGVPFFSYDALRWPLHPKKCAGHRHAPKYPEPITEKVVKINISKR
jgi:hypothetical protein